MDNKKIIAQLLMALTESIRARIYYNQDYRESCGCEECVEINSHIALIEEVSHKKFEME